MSHVGGYLQSDVSISSYKCSNLQGRRRSVFYGRLLGRPNLVESLFNLITDLSHLSAENIL